MGKENEYTLPKRSGTENYKEWARETIFALEDSGLWGYVDGTIIKPVSLSSSRGEGTNRNGIGGGQGGDSR